MKFTEEVRDIVLKRAAGKCERCGLPIKGSAEYHHRRPRGMGGSKDPAVGSASNCLLLHPGCHGHIESYRMKGRGLGYLVSQTQDPQEVAVKRWDGWVLLQPDGGLVPVDEPLPAGQSDGSSDAFGEDSFLSPTHWPSGEVS
jgi:5-methylcytosine-specific restriction protein A